MKHRTYIDGNSIGYAAAQRKGRKLTSGAQETTAIFGALQTIRKHLEQLGGTAPVVLWDGRSWRKDAYAEYKANRTATPEQVAERERYKAQKKLILKAFYLIGVPQLIADNMEADDLAALLVRRAIAAGETVTLLTGDKDWLQLVQPGVVWVDHKMDRRCTPASFLEFTGFRTPRAFVHSKALQGDAGDNVPGCGGIGEKGAKELLSVFSCVREFTSFSEVEVHALWAANGLGKKVAPKFMKLRTDPEVQANFERGLVLMDLNHTAIPTPVGLKVIRDPVNREGFIALCAELGFHSILRDVDAFLRPFTTIQELQAA